MPKTIFGGAHAAMVEVLVSARKKSGLRQVDLADRIGKGQTFISLIEQSQRRIDVLEFIALARAMDLDPERLFAEVLDRVPTKIEI